MAASHDDDWQFHVVPNFWLPALDASADVTLSRLSTAEGTVVGPVGLSVESSPDDDLSNLVPLPDEPFLAMNEDRQR